MSTTSSQYDCRNALLRGEIVEINGKSYRRIDGDIENGDLYFAERNTGPKILTARNVNRDQSWIVPNEPGYVYDIHECIRIEEI